MRRHDPDHLVNLRLASKQMVRASKKAEGSEKEAKNKLKKAIEARNTEGARIYAQVSRQSPLSACEVEWPCCCCWWCE